MATAQSLIKQGDVRVDWKLEFRTWSGSAWEWTDYSKYLVNFSGIGSMIEQSAIPHAFRMNLGTITVDNTGGFWTDVDTLDGKLVNAAQAYGKKFYKRLVRISEVRYDTSGTGTTTVIGTGAVRDLKVKSDGLQAVIQIISLDAIAADQRADGDTVQRHPIGSTDKSTPSSWTTSDPASDTAEVALFRYRDEEPEDDQVVLGLFKNRRVIDVIERTAWAMDDLATDIQDNVIYTDKGASTNERVTSLNIPPDDTLVSNGLTPDRTRAIVWNPVRNVLVCCVGHKIYDYDPLTNVYTLRNTLTAGRDVTRIWYITKADSSGKDKRIVLLQYDIDDYATRDSRTASGWSFCTVLDASGNGPYSLLLNERTLQFTTFFPGTHSIRESAADFQRTGVSIGQQRSDTLFGENVVVPFQQTIHTVATNASYYEGSPTTLWQQVYADNTDALIPVLASRGHFTIWCEAWAHLAMGLKVALGTQPAATINLHVDAQGGWLCTFDHFGLPNSPYTLMKFSLWDYTGPTALPVQSGSELQPPLVVYSHPSTSSGNVYVSQMEWRDSPHPATSYARCHLSAYRVVFGDWFNFDFDAAATGSNQAWTIIDLCFGPDNLLSAILFNRETLNYRFCSQITQILWSGTDAACQTFYTTGRKDNENPLRGMHRREGGSGWLYFVESGPNRLWSWDGTTLRQENENFPINSDSSVYPCLTSTASNYPDADTPGGMMFGLSVNDNPNVGALSPAGEYVLWQYANRLSGFIQRVTVEGLSIWRLRTLLAVAFGYVTYYAPDGTLVFKSRTRTGAATVTFSAANRNYYGAEIVARGWEAIVNDIVVKPYALVSESRMSPIEKGASGSNGFLVDIGITGNPSENSQWRLVFTGASTWELFKLSGLNSHATISKATGDINTIERGITDGLYLTIMPTAFEGTFETGDNFTWWVFEPQETLEQLDFRDWSRAVDATSIDNWQRTRSSGEIDNRFIAKLYAPWIAKEILNWRKDPHARVRIEAVYDGTLLPLAIIAINDTDLGFDGTETFQIMGVKHASDRMRTTIEAVQL